jgi:hypothetical protein
MYKQSFFKQHPEEKKNLSNEMLARLELATNIILDYAIGNKTREDLIKELSEQNYTYLERRYVREIFNDAFKMVENEDCFYRPNPHMAYLHQIEALIYLKQDEMLTIWEFMDELNKYSLTDLEKTYFAQQHLRRLEDHKKATNEEVQDECPHGFIKNE